MMLNAQAAPPTAQPMPELGHLKAMAERVSVANYNLATFFARFFGPVPEGGVSADKDAAVGCYRNDLTAVFEQIARLEELTNGLQSIG